MAKRDQTPPYEIMRIRATGGATGSAPPVSGEQDPLGSNADSADGAEGQPTRSELPVTKAVPNRAPWWVGSSAPLVLRLPRGIAILGLAGVLLVIVLAYWVGSMRGAASAEPEVVDSGLGERAGPSGWFESPQDTYEGTEVDVPEKPLTAERREPGKNYMQLITSSREDCEQIATFFGEAGVAIQLVPVNNKELWVAYAVMRGYRGDELSSESCKRYEQKLRALGRKFKASNNGQGTDLSTMIFKRYNGN